MKDGLAGRILAYAAVCLSILFAVYLALSTLSSPPSESRSNVSDSLREETPPPAIQPHAVSKSALPETLPATVLQERSLTGFLEGLSDAPFVVPGEVILKFRYASDIAALRSRSRRLGIEVLWSDHRLRTARVAFSDGAALAAEIESNQDQYKQIGPNFTMAIPGLPAETDLQQDLRNAGGATPFRESMLESIGAARDRSTWGEGVTVAVLDSGIEAHPSLSQASVTRINLSHSPDIHGHGTAMASLIAGQRFPAEGIAPASKLLDIRVTNERGGSNTGLVAEAIMTAIDQRADVINVSLGSFGDSSLLQEAIGMALDRNIIVVAAAGNEQLTQLVFPAAYEGVISVGAVDAGNTQAYFSNSGDTLTISAPGVGIISAYSDEQIVLGSGTSQATAITSGVVAALLSHGKHPRNIRSILEQNAFQTGASRDRIGAGVIRIPQF